MSSPRSVLNFSPFRFRSARVASRGFGKARSATNGLVHRLRIEPLESRRMLTTFLVDSLADVVNPDDGVLTLREAIQAANNRVGMDEIVFAPSLAGGKLVMNGQYFDLADSIVIRGPEGGSVTVDAGGASRVFFVGAETILSGLTITGGHWSTFGGGIRCYDAALTLVNCVVVGNTAGNYGAAIAASSASTVTVINSTITGNRATNTAGGVYLDGTSTLTMHNSILALNQASSLPDLSGSPAAPSSHNLIGGDPGFVRAPAVGDLGDLRLAEGSPAIDAGDTAMLIAPGGQTIAFDVNGDPRVSGSTIDIGACEFKQAVIPDERLPGDANGDRTVDAADAARLAANWGKSGMKWADGDFNNDGLVNAIDAAILAAHFGMTLPVATEATPTEPSVPAGHGDVLGIHIVGPLPVGESAVAREPLRPVQRRTEAAASVMTSAKSEEDLSAELSVGSGVEPGTYVPRSPGGVRATDAVLSESTGLLNRRGGWVGVLARRHVREESGLDGVCLAADRLLTQW